MMGEVVDPGDAFGRPQDFEPPADSAKVRQPGPNLGKFQTDCVTQGDRRQRIEHVVLPGHAERESADEVFAIDDVKSRSVGSAP